ncbi:putative subunit g of F-type H+-transporting ATPase [Chloropicon primus]|uniref:Putative subunit g of F-type H+-transporting ATPase n=1 Tax=Chloropicon primus TaxID=1764295 RepID=A0A5B8MFB7_9CHLO|nr:putative subunit g of F-type H+-transporting ATPase [Chloropicon primus]UPQ98337.1 putative subunit g of F-type H+-transporting ATPase [Chloropicon primus]|mmetsp:Transcript_3565/g.8080  ORF Transcript_3565/g.8080 Transcript_3565/m.8080 type:complete len:125 (+) Transcript_3565:367-741(+)|eukprot:QDZ19129.1 putative subunit g of F-type H+-transporting ATPase [Chloropicon primus]
MSGALRSMVKSTRSLAEVASKTVCSNAQSQYKKVMEANAKYVLEDKSKLVDMPKQYIFTHLAELPANWAKATREWQLTKAQLSGWRELSSNEAATGLLFAGEVFAWFCVGEYIGRGFSLTGYDY